jgi:CHAD domain-containing protein
MAYRFEADESVEEGLRRIAAEQLARARAELDDPELDLHTTVHQVRKRCKKVRGLLRVVRPALAGDTYDAENAALRDAARLLSPLRDAAVLAQTVEGLVGDRDAVLDPEAFAPAVAALRKRRDAEAGAADGASLLDDVTERLESARRRTADWTLEAKGWDALAGGVHKTWKRGQKAMAAALEAPGPERLHTWRKRSKYTLYHLRLLRDAWPGPMDAWEEAQHAHSDVLGEDHDLAVLCAHMDEAPARFGTDAARETLRGVAMARRRSLQARAARLGRRLYAGTPGACVDRLGAWVEAWRGEAA